MSNVKKILKRNPNWVDPNAGSTNIRVRDETFDRLNNFPVRYKMTMNDIVRELLDCWEAVGFYGKDQREFIAEMKIKVKEKEGGVNESKKE